MAPEKSALLVIASNFRDEELFETKAELEKAGLRTVVAAMRTGTITGMLQGKAEAEIPLKQVNVDDYDAVIFVGGSGSSVYFSDSTALKIARLAAQKGKVVAAICIAPSILANAGLLKGRKATAFSSEKANLAAKGAHYTGEAVTVDGKIVTASGPAAAKEFGKKIAEALK